MQKSEIHKWHLDFIGVCAAAYIAILLVCIMIPMAVCIHWGLSLWPLAVCTLILIGCVYVLTSRKERIRMWVVERDLAKRAEPLVQLLGEYASNAYASYFGQELKDLHEALVPSLIKQRKLLVRFYWNLAQSKHAEAHRRAEQEHCFSQVTEIEDELSELQQILESNRSLLKQPTRPSREGTLAVVYNASYIVLHKELLECHRELSAKYSAVEADLKRTRIL